MRRRSPGFFTPSFGRSLLAPMIPWEANSLTILLVETLGRTGAQLYASAHLSSSPVLKVAGLLKNPACCNRTAACSGFLSLMSSAPDEVGRADTTSPIKCRSEAAISNGFVISKLEPS